MTDVSVDQVRLFLGERIPVGGNWDDTNFSDEEVDALIYLGDGSLNITVAWGWEAKCALLSDLIDRNEDGSELKLAQAYDHARKQADAWGKKAKDEYEDLTTGMRAVGAKLFNVYSGGGCYDGSQHTMSIFSDDNSFIDNVRLYPLKRFFAVL